MSKQYNATLQAYNAQLQALIDTANNLPEAGTSGSEENLSAELDAQEAKLNQLISILNTKASGSGAANPTASQKDVNFYDYDGTILYSYTVEEAQALTELPPLPSQPGLICQEWNYNLETIKSYNRAVDVGATYTTDDDKTRLYIRIAAEGRMNVPLYFSQTIVNGVTIDWGDGSDTQTISSTGNKNISHTYSNIGDYVISLEVADGCTLGLGHGSAAYCVMGTTNKNGKIYNNMLQKVEIGNKVTSIGNYAFNGCHSLASIVIPNSVTSIGLATFQDCHSLTSIVIPNNVTSINNYAFNGCHSLASIVIPNSVTSIGTSAFSSCYSLASVVISNSVTSIDTFAFEGCHSLISIVIPNNVTSIGSNAFYDCYSLASIVIPNNVTSIGSNAFRYCYSLTSIVIPNSVTNIATFAFRSCHSLASIVIPNGVTSIGNYAFYDCYSLASVVIPNNVTSINNYAFDNCSGMAIYDFTSHTSVPTLSDTNAFNSIPSDCEIRVPAALYDEWIAATNWSTYASQIVAV